MEVFFILDQKNNPQYRMKGRVCGMIVVVDKTKNKEKVEQLKRFIISKGFSIDESIGNEKIILGLIGDTVNLQVDELEKFKIVSEIKKVLKPYKKANRMFKSEDTIIDILGVEFGGGSFPVIAGPCSVETEEQIIKIAKSIKKSGANMLRGGAFKPRTSPYSFQGLELEGLKLLKLASAETGLPIVSELMSTKYLDVFVEDVDLIQIGARNMQNFDLLKELGKIDKPILLKRGLSATIEEWLMSAEYIMAGGNERVILCERGVRSFDMETRNMLDLQAIPIVKRNSHLPIIIDPSHASGKSFVVPSMSKAAVVSGADGLMVEVHNDPENAWSDGKQCLNLDEFDEMMKKIKLLVDIDRG